MLNQKRLAAACFGFALGSIVTIGGGFLTSAQGQDCSVQRGSRSLTCATIYQIFRSVRLRSAERGISSLSGGEVIFPDEQLQTLAGSRAELQFNDGSLAWTRAGTIFQFRLGLRLIQLRGGATLVVTEPGAPPINVRTAEANVRPRGTAYVVQRDEGSATTDVFVLTDNPDGPLQVTSTTEGEPTAELSAGEMVSANADGLSEIEEFDLEVFYSTNPLVAGLGPNQESAVADKPAAVQQTLTSVRVETLAAVRAQNAGFRQTFLESALLGSDVDFDLDPNVRQDPGGPEDGTYTAGDEFDDETVTGVVSFERDAGLPISGFNTSEIIFELRDGDLQTIRSLTGPNMQDVILIDRDAIRSSSFGLSGDQATGTVILDNGSVLRLEAFDVNGELMPGDSVRGTLTPRSSFPDR